MFAAALFLLAACGGPSAGRDGPSTTAAAAPLGEELLANGDFDRGDQSPDGWELSAEHPGQVADWRSFGDRGRVAYMAAPVIEDVSWPQLISTEAFAVDPGNTYRLSVNARTDGLGLLFISMAFSDASGTEISAIGPGSPVFESTDWTKFDFDIVPPAGAVSARIILRLALNQSLTEEPNLSIYVDRVSVRTVES